MAKKKKQQDEEVVGFLGIGLDAADGHQRLSQSENFVLVGGSSETHEHMQDTALHFDESLKKRGKVLREISAAELLELLRDALRH